MTSRDANFINLYDKYVDSIYRFIYFRVGDKDTAWDITQDCFLKALEYIAENEVRQPRAFLYQVARNLVIDHWKLRGRQSSVELSEVDIIDDTNIEADLDIKNRVKEIMGVVGELPDHHRDLLILRYVDDLSFSEIAEILNKSQVSLRVQVSRLIKDLRLKLVEE